MTLTIEEDLTDLIDTSNVDSCGQTIYLDGVGSRTYDVHADNLNIEDLRKLRDRMSKIVEGG